MRWKPPAPGEYSVDIFVEETKETYSQSVTVEAADPEKDNTRPDFDHLYQLASYADEDVLRHLTDAERKHVLDALRRPKLEGEQKDE